MGTIKQIVVGVDDGDYSWEAVELIRRLADGVGADVTAFHAATDDTTERLLERASQLEIRLESAPVDGGTTGIADALIEHAAGLDDAVLALTSHARRGLSAAFLGSTASAVLEASSEPVLLVGPHHSDPSPIERVLACVDGSKHSESILAAACRWARAAGAPLWLVHVIEPNVSIEGGRADANYVQRIAEELDADGIDLEFDVLHSDHPGRSIADYANLQPGTLTALTTHGRSGLRAITIGSVAMEVTRRATGPTLVVRPGPPVVDLETAPGRSVR
jgi:nucleotide-binding universal stress UspA family protein